MMNQINFDNWIYLYIVWEISLIKELGFDFKLHEKKHLSKDDNHNIEINGRSLKIPRLLLYDKITDLKNYEIKIVSNRIN